MNRFQIKINYTYFECVKNNNFWECEYYSMCDNRHHTIIINSDDICKKCPNFILPSEQYTEFIIRSILTEKMFKRAA